MAPGSRDLGIAGVGVDEAGFCRELRHDGGSALVERLPYLAAAPSVAIDIHTGKAGRSQCMALGPLKPWSP
jgi:hypothetical protein